MEERNVTAITAKLYLNKALTLIENHLSESINVEQLAGDCYVSPRQLYRDFYSLTGHPVQEYIRRRRLSKALQMVKYSDMDLSAIAYAYGYSSQAAFCRNVKAFLNMTPKAYKRDAYHYYFPVFHTGMGMQIEVKSEQLPVMLTIHYDDRQLAGIENRAVQALLSLCPDYNGMLLGRNEKQTGRHFCYELQVENSEMMRERLQKSIFVVKGITPPLKRLYAKTIVKNAEADINQAWNYLYSEWMKNSMFEPDDTPYFEQYVLGSGQIQRLVLHLPLRQRVGYPAISIQACPERRFLAATKCGVHAEKAASDLLTAFLASHYPYLLETQKEYYVSDKKEGCTCGILLSDNRYVPDDGSISILTVPAGRYAVMENRCYGNRRDEEAILGAWLTENGMQQDGDAFTVYDASGGAEPGDIHIRSYIKMAENDNTATEKRATI
jgi:AraC-like DNA-binding protein/DNA gyrase inhibitor GyrI